MELSLNIKHDMREKVLQQYQEKYGDTQGVSEEIEIEIQKINKMMDAKRKEGLKALKSKLKDIMQDQKLSANDRLQKLYDNNEFKEIE